jgi:plasmid stabilization system protein ParE
VNITYAEEAIADILDAIAYLNERNPAAASSLDTDLAACIEHVAAGEFEGPLSRLRSGSLVRSWPVPPFRIYYERQPGELLILRVYHQTRRPIVR